jgi:hypothetical protein
LVYVRPYLNWIEERSTKPKVVGSSPAGRALCQSIAIPVGVAVVQAARIATPVDWLFAPDWLTFEQARFLSGWDPDGILRVITEGGVDLNGHGLIEKRSLYEFQEALALVLYWQD